ncbi:MAG: undecaprenyl/decaprenyl-phosphate alpha-N-acetylglucosaminyl 1-phosphate transferase [Nitrospiraceae bacterium]|nr:MAG: undecaprenyl/decaprenyl-phosphate alpha-N-acetylglucosaminyl 1-phosphate transferase [Nitrospiraceae bacterium]
MAVSVLMSVLIVLLATPLMRRFALAFDILDIPDHRKSHGNAVPLLGGVAVYFGIASGLFSSYESFHLFSGLLLGGTLIVVAGVIDDVRGLSSGTRLAIQVMAACMVIISGYRIDFLPNTMMGNIGEVLLTVIWITGITNAVNYMDGLDGLAAGIAAISAHCFSIIAALSGQYSLCVFTQILAVVCLAFIPFNLKGNKIFLGDAGSTFLGFTLAGIAVIGHWASDHVLRLSVPVLILGVPIFDMIFTTIMRVKEGKIHTVGEWLDYAGKDHFHHRLIDIGLRSRSSVLFIFFIAIALGISAIIVSQSEETFVGLMAILQGIIIFGTIGVLMIVGAGRRSGWDISDT